MPSTQSLTPTGYKQTEVGVIPEDWEVRPVYKIASIKTGPFGTLLKASEYSESDGVPLISVSEIRQGFLRITNHTPRVSEIVTRKLPEYILRKGDIVFGRKGAVERSALIRDHQDGWFLGSDGISIRPWSDYHNEYLALQFQSTRVQRWLLHNAIGTTMPSLNQGILRRIIIPLPPTLAEQRAIADALSDADAYIEALEQRSAKQRAVKQGAMQELLTGRRRLPGFSGEWEVRRLGDLVNFYKGKGLSKSVLDPFGNQPCIHYGELFTQYSETIREVLSRTNTHENGFYSISNDVLMPTSDVTPNGLAKASCIKIDNVLIGGDVLIIRSKINQMEGSFLSYLIRLLKDRILQLITGTTVFHLYAADMKRFTFSLPPIREQQAIISCLEDMDASLAAQEAQLAKARQVKQGMLQELLTGRVRLV